MATINKYSDPLNVKTTYEKSVQDKLSNIPYPTADMKSDETEGIAYIVDNDPTDTQLERDYVTKQIQGIEQAYFTDTWLAENPVYPEIVGAKFVRTHADDGTFIGSLPLHLKPDSNTYADKTSEGCDNSVIGIPSICISDDLKNALNGVVTSDSITSKVIQEILKLADDVDKVPEAKQIAQFLEKEYVNLPKILQDKYNSVYKNKIKEQVTLDKAEKATEYQDLSAYLNAPFPRITTSGYEESQELKDLLKKLEEIGLEDYNLPVVEVNNEDLTERAVNGLGSFDILAKALFNQLDMARKSNLITQADVGSIYSQTLVQALQTASQFSLEKANVLNQSYALRVQALQASVEVMKAKAELLTLPIQVKLQYAQLEAQLKQIELLKVQVDLEKEKYPQVIAQTDLILAQIDGQRVQNQQQVVGLQQAEMQLDLLQEQHKQALLQTETMTLQNNKLIQDTKLVDTQVQSGLKDVELKDISKIAQKAQIKLMAQQLEKEKENLGLVKAQVATAFAQLSLVKNQQKASIAQYSDTIDGKPVGGLLGAQILVNKIQASSFERDAFNKLVTQVQGGWAANKTADIAIQSPAAFTPLMVDRVMSWGFTKYFNMPNDLMSMPKDYTPYLTDEQMDATEPMSLKIKTKSK